VKQTLFLLFFFLHTFLYAQIPSFKEIEGMPTSYAKDYYTWRFLQEKNTTKKEAIIAYKWTKRKSHKLRKAIRKKVGYVPRINSKKKKKQDSNNYIIYPETAAQKSRTSLKKLYKKIKKQNKYSEVLHIMSSDTPFKTWLMFPAKTQTYIFNRVGTKYRKKRLNKTLSKKNLQKLIQSKQFNQSIYKIVTTHSLQNLKKSLVLTPDNNLTFQSNFLLAINALEFHEEKKALNFLAMARTKTTFQSHYDQINFWNYLISQDKKYLEKLKNSNQVNIYTLRARDILKLPYPDVVTPHLGYSKIKNIDITNPIDWEKIKIEMKKNPKKLHELAEKYKSHETEGIYSYIKEKATKYKVPYYPMPYREAMWGLSKKRTATLYALARQESRFVPASVSPSYALGMLQIMPFLIKHLAKERKEKLDLNEMFNPYVAISYANQHMDYLNKSLYHPLFVAYAYNGGIGFTRRTIRSQHLFKKGKYEPFLSMELIDSIEARDYGKKVLANYVIYANLLGIKTELSPLLDKLAHPSQTDRFRK
jgi:soluble lytic murein transglycosylase